MAETKQSTGKTAAVKRDSRQTHLKKLTTLRQQLVEQHQQLRAGGSTNVRAPRLIRKKIARILTALRQQEIKQEKEAGNG